MDRIHYAGDSFLTGTEIAHALLAYAERLARANSSATVRVPTRLSDGSVGRTEVLIGPASQLACDAEPSDYDEILDDELVASITAETRLLEPVSARVMSEKEADLAMNATPEWTEEL